MRTHGSAHTYRGHIPSRLLAGLGFAVCVPAVTVLWLLLATIPVLADGGPHVISANGGTGATALTADSCAGCHRAHTSKDTSGFLLTGPGTGIEDFCRSCHGATATGAATDVDSGIQYSLASRSGTAGTVLGALRGGGFVNARIGSASAQRYRFQFNTDTTDFLTKVPVGSSRQVTSAHIAIAGSAFTNPTGIAWGYSSTGDYLLTANAGTPYSGGLHCTSCHNPHGNGQYRILNPLPADDATTGGVKPTTAVNVTDAALPPAGDTRNYTVIQTSSVSNPPGYLLLASQVLASPGLYPPTSGDYFHRYVPWNNAGGKGDAPNGIDGASSSSFNSQINKWCAQCHTRYLNTVGPGNGTLDPTPDPIFSYQHQTMPGDQAGRTVCTTCHVAHGSNAVMNTDASQGTTFSANVPYPNGQTNVGDSRLLKFDGRGTCLACHDPTGTVPLNTYQGPTPNPVVP
jgi:predicted CXXCH cytochrome family protein